MPDHPYVHSVLSRLFPDYRRVSNRAASEAKRCEGEAAMLAIARGLVEAHGGRIWAENRPEGGAAVSFTIPAPAQPASTAAS